MTSHLLSKVFRRGTRSKALPSPVERKTAFLTKSRFLVPTDGGEIQVNPTNPVERWPQISKDLPKPRQYSNGGTQNAGKRTCKVKCPGYRELADKRPWCFHVTPTKTKKIVCSLLEFATR